MKEIKEQLIKEREKAGYLNQLNKAKSEIADLKIELKELKENNIIIPRKEIENRHIIISTLYDMNGDKWMREVRNTFDWLLNYNKEKE